LASQEKLWVYWTYKLKCYSFFLFLKLFLRGNNKKINSFISFLREKYSFFGQKWRIYLGNRSFELFSKRRKSKENIFKGFFLIY